VAHIFDDDVVAAPLRAVDLHPALEEELRGRSLPSLTGFRARAPRYHVTGADEIVHHGGVDVLAPAGAFVDRRMGAPLSVHFGHL